MIVENEESFYPLMGLLPDCPLICGRGKQILGADFIKEYNYLSAFYWGDLDPDGYEIMDGVNIFFPQIIPVLMDQNTILRYQELSVPQSVRPGKPQPLAMLDGAYRLVCQQDLRIEQEKIPLDEVQAFLLAYMKNKL